MKKINDDIIKVPRTIVGMMCKTLKHMVKAIEKPKFFDIPKEEDEAEHIIANICAILVCNVLG